jgi:hypothetical protein
MNLELDFNSREEKLFNECTDSIVKTDPKGYCRSFIVPETPFELWNAQTIDTMCSGAATHVVLDCSDGSCTPCADAISYVYTRYANLLD